MKLNRRLLVIGGLTVFVGSSLAQAASARTHVVVMAPASVMVAQPAALGVAPDVNCAALSGTPYMCVKNAAMTPIVGVEAINGNVFNPNAWINIPGGPIMPGGTSIVKFPAWSGGCVQTVFVKTASGQTHAFPRTDVCHYSSFIVRGW